ncbi:hypothetical protein BDA99DRAFT_477977 [Phascolomyces articulosus]|uniref:Actin-like ATPase domain-containing protein n=1 Tax=Phascolomyces articulosus TaxID=60185 RepID=A0AAD5K6T3_9FUNG|nr:hypothetical protein BDA99DRAFT_477977 [Phascolomyces articulosus]
MLSSNPQQPPTEYKVVIGYDFGTTYSGAAYAFTHSTPTEVFDIQKWPHKGGNFFPKVPTLSVYPRRNKQQLSGRSALSEWGHGAKKAMLKPGADKQNVLLSQFKLHLDESLHRPPLENELTPVQAVADYLTALHEHTLEELSRGFANNYDPDTFRYCLTVPAVWSDKAKNLMRQASIQAGLITPSDPSDRLTLISEPEAAALYCEETMAEQVQLQDNDRIMICDAGGGTVDLIVFQVNFPNGVYESASDDDDSASRKKRQLKEVTKGMGESCGSVFLDARYRELLETKLGTSVMSKIYPREMNDLMDQFIDTIKPEFNVTEDYYVTLPRSVDISDLPSSLRDNDDGDLDEGILKLSGEELKKEVFDPVVDKVLLLIEQQHQQIPDGRLDFLFLVGGFGSSKYLYQRIHDVYKDTKVNQIVCPAERAALAVVRGAVYHGVNPRVVVSRVSRRTYGINADLLYDDAIDPPSSRVVKPDGSVKCKTGFFTFVKKNDELSVDHCIQKEFFVYYGRDKSVDLYLYATENDTIPRYFDAPGVQCVAKMSVPIPTMPGMSMNDHLNFTVRMYFGTTEIRMEADFGTGQKYDVHGDFDAVDNYGS